MGNLHPTSYIFILAFIIQTIYYFRYFIPLIFAKDLYDKSVNEGVSVIICAHNEIAQLKKNLSSLLQQRHPNFELIVVVDRSTDGSLEWLKNLNKQYSALKIVSISEVPKNLNPKKFALRMGLENAVYDIILLTDADCYAVSDQWIDRMAHSFTTDTEIVLGISLYEKNKSLLNRFIQFETWQTAILYLSFALKAEPYMGVGRNLAYRKSLFKNKNIFQDISHLMGGDDDLIVNKHANAKNTKIQIDKKSLTISTPKSTIKEYLIQKKRHLSIGKYYKFKDKFKIGMFHLSQSVVYITFIFICILGTNQDYLLLGLLTFLRLIGQYVLMRKVSIKFGVEVDIFLIPIVELVFIFYYWIWGIYATLTNQLKWK